ncbi:hypothetical protein CBA19CS22_39480 [Caballeronia novacaledonica]|uniref:Uncharacterized protein n=1 Tax=Caballeronia novacaledonica TaxID=1544861 RepID=A0ACB5R5Z3_9BURK|nr:hypothetical protein [Caballeronia sp. LZ029]MDR5749052.1 hypothetical protein [Caballeronia sp. LZ029]GJH22760.1 hypothetical protein CBA19CS22_39480 [Caballeronia novacaledonica]
MKRTVRVKFITISGPQTGKVTVRIRWILGQSENARGTAQSPTDVEFPLPEDVFHVKLENDAGVSWTFDVSPRPLVMLDPPRDRTVLDTENRFFDWLPASGNWDPVDPDAQTLKKDPNDPNSDTLALGVAHILGQSSVFAVESKLRRAAAQKLRDFLARKKAHFSVLNADEIDLHAVQFAAIFRLFPLQPVRVLRDSCRLALSKSRARLPLWMESAIGSASDKLAADHVSRPRRLATLLSLLLENDLYADAVRIKGEADNMRALMAMRAAQGGQLLDFGCDYDKTGVDKPTNPCLPQDQGRIFFAAEALGLGVDYVLDEAAASGLKVAVEHDRSASATSTAYAFPNSASSKGYDPGSYPVAPSRQSSKAGRSRGAEMPPSGAFTAWVDYDLVSSHPVPINDNLEIHLEQVMSFAKPLTGDGVLAIRMQMNAAPREPYDFLYNVYGAWDGESTGTLQKYFDDPDLQPSLEELRPFLITRRYSFRRDLERFLSRLPPSRVAALNLVGRPPAEATLQMPLKISQNGKVVSYPTKGMLPPGFSQTLLNLRACQPNAEGVKAGAKWDRVEGALPFTYDNNKPGHKLWTVEDLRVDSDHHPDKPQRYRFWVTAVDVFEQESDPIPVLAAAPMESDVKSFIFTPRWQSPPPPPKNIAVGTPIGSLTAAWEPGDQSVIGTASTIVRSGLVTHFAVLRRPVTTVQLEKDKSGFVETALETLAASGVDNPVLERAVRDAAESGGWKIWQSGIKTTPDATWPLSDADKGFEYEVLLSNAVGTGYLKYVQDLRDQTLRYLIQSGPDDAPVFQEARWMIPREGENARFRAYAAFSSVASFGPVKILPVRGSLPSLACDLSQADVVRASAIRAVTGINRDAALSKFLALKNLVLPGANALSIAERVMLEAALKRLSPDMLNSEQTAMVGRLLEAEFIVAAGTGSATQHPVVGFRGAVNLRWVPRALPNTTAPVVLFRVYTARTPLPFAQGQAQYEFDGTWYRFIGGTSPIVPEGRPVMVIMSTKTEQWAGLADFKGNDFLAAGLSSIDVSMRGKGEPQIGDQVSCCFHEGHVAVETAAFPERSEYVAGLPIDGGHREFGAWWIVAVNCINDEQWRTPSGSPLLYMRTLYESITPERPLILEARPPADYMKDALQPDKYQPSLQFIPEYLLKEAAPVFPRSILSFDRREFAGPEQYIFIEREFEPVQNGTHALADDAQAWGILKSIESQAAGSQWSEDYRVLTPWLEGGPAPVPPEGLQFSTPIYFFPLENPAAWNLKHVDMIDSVDAPPNISSFVDYFAFPPGDPTGDGGKEPSRGTARVRYRAYKVLDLAPESGPPVASQWLERFLVSEPTAWTAWTRPEWPPITYWPPTSTSAPRNGKPLVQISVSSRYPAQSLNAAASGLAIHNTSNLFLRVALRRRMEAAFAESETERSIGELLEVALPGAQPNPVSTADHSLERDDPGMDRSVQYLASAALVWRRVTSDGSMVEEELRTSPDLFVIPVRVPSKFGGTEAALCIHLEVRIG